MAETTGLISANLCNKPLVLHQRLESAVMQLREMRDNRSVIMSPGHRYSGRASEWGGLRTPFQDLRKMWHCWF